MSTALMIWEIGFLFTTGCFACAFYGKKCKWYNEIGVMLILFILWPFALGFVIWKELK